MMVEWRPSAGIEPSSELMSIITHDRSVAVLASAGAGKTELLAQKANYLFFTDNCSWPKRILSLTFKTEAQQNISHRVKARCGNKSSRFDSFTFHAFCKSIVDRFKNVLPECDRPIDNYDIVFRSQEADGNKKILMNNLLSLAISILNSRTDIRQMFTDSYAYVFVDEFQDTSDQQYNLLKILFKNTSTKLLTVGDINQSIMLWAGARKTVFKDFETDFHASKKFLLRNYRASEEVQNVLKILLEYIQDTSKLPDASKKTVANCSIQIFKDEYQEAEYVVGEVQKLINDGINPGEICILSKQQSPQYTEIIREGLNKAKINNLEMSNLQDALKEPLGRLFSLTLNALICPSPKVMTELYDINMILNRVDSDDDIEDKLTKDVSNFISEKRQLLDASTTVQDVLSHIISFIHHLGLKKIKGRWKQYKSPDYYKQVWNTLEEHLKSLCSQSISLIQATELFDAENAVQLMNVHKCKGLEYHAVFFIGLEDQAFWNYSSETFENNCLIYVALSRAKKTIYVTYTKTREHRARGRFDNRASTYVNIKPIIDLLIKNCKFIAINHTK